MPTHTFAQSKLFFEDTGGAGLPVLLLHAFPLHSGMFSPQREALRSKYRIVTPDFRGFGQSEGVSAGSTTTMESLADEALALLDHLGLAEVVVGGVSMGGYVAMALLRLDPSRVKGLVLADTHLRADDAETKERRAKTAEDVEAKGTSVLVENMLPKLIAPGAPAELRGQLAHWIRETSPSGAAAASRGMALRADSRDILARFGGPALVLVGEQDGITPPDRATEMASMLAGSTKVVLPDAGHLSNLEAASAFNRELDVFLSRLA